MKPTFAPVFTSPLRRPFRTSRLAGFSTVTEHGVPGRGRPRARAVPPLEHADGSSLLSMPRQGDPPRGPASSDDRWQPPRIRPVIPLRPHDGTVVAHAGERRDGHPAARTAGGPI